MSFRTGPRKSRMKKPPIIVFLVLLVLVAVSGVVMASFLLTINTPVTVTPPPATLTSVTIGTVACTITGSTASCPSTNLAQGTSTTLAATVQGAANAPVSVGATANPSGIANIVPASTNPTTLDSTGHATFDFTVTGVAQGSTTVTVTLSV